ncbi:hypothetical protein NQ315_017421 [Exocentrus adspersus]|uniref:Endonuclease/exonuclease/phosphatase domain-containing protein n=1 Tax=Exocentrus adspersus TaxID=1586481 RepID=A0AAV8VLP3_9CUCU|nr:hypothetical protein NQ315_017421 [Exocentrus adspersus]
MDGNDQAEVCGKLNNVNIAIDNITQNSYKNKLLVYGANEKPNEDLFVIVINIFNNKLSKQILKTDLVNCYRYGKKIENKTRPILVEFLHVWKRNDVFYAKSALKNSNQAIAELLTNRRYELYREARGKFKNDCWTKNGVIIFIMDKRKHFVSSFEEYNKIMERSITIAHLNIRSLLPKLVHLKSHVLTDAYDVLCLSETWLTQTISDNLISLDNYNLVRADRHGNRGGGVLLYIKKHIAYKILTVNNNIEQLWIKFKLGGIQTAVGVLYRPWNVNVDYFIDALELALSVAGQECDQLFLLGDFNIDLLKPYSSSAQKLNQVLDSFGLCQLVNSPTRITPTSETLLDLVITSSENCISSIDVLSLNHISDHELIVCTLNVKSDKKQPIYKTLVARKKAYFEQKFQVNGINNLWKDLKHLNIKNKKSDIPDHLKDVNAINSYYINSIPHIPADQDTINFYLNKTTNSDIAKLTFKAVNESTIQKILYNIKTNAQGDDGLNIKMLLMCCPLILPAITHIINACLSDGCFPECWKQALVKPLPKTASPAEYKDLRPVSVLPVMSKILERVVDEQLRDHRDNIQRLVKLELDSQKISFCDEVRNLGLTYDTSLKFTAHIKKSDVHNLNIRFKGRLTPPVHRTERFKRSFSYQITKKVRLSLRNPPKPSYGLPVYSEDLCKQYIALRPKNVDHDRFFVFYKNDKYTS